MKPKIKADVASVRTLNPIDYFSGNQKAFSTFNGKKYQPSGQCCYCGSDYVRFMVNSFCQYCQQKAEFVRREHPQILENLKHQGG